MPTLIQLCGGTCIHLSSAYEWRRTACGIEIAGRKFSRINTSDIPMCERCMKKREYDVKQANEEPTQLTLKG